MPKGGFVYIVSNKSRTVLYIGSSSSIWNRMFKHKKGTYVGFARKYGCVDLLYYEEFVNIADAVKRERQMKEWKRAWKWELIHKMNPDLKDLAADWFDEDGQLKDDYFL